MKTPSLAVQVPIWEELAEISFDFPHFCFIMVRYTLFIFICLVISSSCGSDHKTNATEKSAPGQVKTSDPSELPADPDYNYIIRLQPGWSMFDTVIQNLEIRFLMAPPSLFKDMPGGNIVIAAMDRREINDFTRANMNNLEKDQPGITLLKEGKIDIGGIDSRWFTYTKNQQGITRDMINYIIPANGFAYMITFGTNANSMEKCRPMFDKMAKTFKLFAYNIKSSIPKLSDTAALLLSDTSSRYMETGFYDIRERHNGVRMHKEHSDEIYYLNNTPFIFVQNVVKARLLRHRLNGSVIPILDLTFDERGTKALKGIGSPLHPSFAVVIANRLLYVITDAEAVQKGEMLILLGDYSDAEIESMLNAVLHKL